MNMRTVWICASVVSLLAFSGWLPAQEPAAAPPPPATPPVTETATAAAPAEAVAPATEQTSGISFIDADLQNVVRTLAMKAGLNLIVGEEVTGKVTVNLKDVSYEEAMRLIVESKGYAFIKEKMKDSEKFVIKIKSRDALEAEPVQVQVFSLNYAKAEDVKKSLESALTKQGKMQVDTRSNTVIVTDTPSNLAKVEMIIKSLDTQTPQVMIEAKFVETTKNPKKDLGLNWGGTLLDHQFVAGSSKVVSGDNGQPISGFQWEQSATSVGYSLWHPAQALLDAGTVKVLFSYLSQDVDTELLASPRVVTTDNGKAKISISTQVPIPEFTYSETKGAFQVSGFTYKDIGIILNVTPHINKDNYVTLEVSPETSDRNKDSDATFQSISIPAVDTRVAQTTVLIKSGNTLAIGGLMRTRSLDKYTKVPVLGDIPGLGVLFRSKSLSKETRNLLIFVTPTIVGPEGQTGFEQYYGGFPKEEAYTNDKWLPKDNAKPRDPFKKTDEPKKQPTQNFQKR